MFRLRRPFAEAADPVLSFWVEAKASPVQRQQGQFEILLRHLLVRFVHNELLMADDETRRILQISSAVALPGLLVALFLFPAYHAFPPFPFPRPFWPQVGDHYFYVMYAFLVMGAATVYDWDLLFPDLLDVFVLSILPITGRRLFAGRVLALVIFLGGILLGTSALGILVFPLAAEQPNALRHLAAHTVAVLASGSFAVGAFLTLQGVLLNLLGERMFRRLTPLLQGGSLMLLLGTLLLYPTLSHALQPLLTDGSLPVRCFPPFWFLGIYERLLAGRAAPPIFSALANTGCWALACAACCTVITYPLAYRRRVRQLIEGGGSASKPGRSSTSLNRLLDATILRSPSQRAIFHFIGQTILRAQRQRVMLAMYGGLALALSLAGMVVLRVGGGHVSPTLLPDGMRAAIPVLAFWTVAGLRSVLNTSVDRRGSWIFQLIPARALYDRVSGTHLWITLWTVAVAAGAVAILFSISPPGMQTLHHMLGQMLVAVGVAVLLTDVALFQIFAIPFTRSRKSAVTDLPFMLLRNVVLFPIFVELTVHFERRIEASALSFLETLLLIGATHYFFWRSHVRSTQQETSEFTTEDLDEFPQRLGL